jgi:superfamily II DNA/RNA helicase
VQALVATDVAARGIHVDDVACVVHFDLPTDAKDYLHRSGRTGRAGATGVVVSLVTEEDGGKIRKLKTALGLPGGGHRPEPRREGGRAHTAHTAHNDKPPRASRPRGKAQPRHPQPRPKGARPTTSRGQGGRRRKP